MLKKNKEQTSEQSFVNAVIIIRMPENEQCNSLENLTRMFQIVDRNRPKMIEGSSRYWTDS